MKLSRDKQNRPWMVGLATSSLISLLIGLGIGVDVSHGGLSSGKAAPRSPSRQRQRKGCLISSPWQKDSSPKL